MPLHIKPIPPLKLTPKIETLSVSGEIDTNPLNHTPMGFAHTIAEVISEGLLNKDIVQWNDKRTKLQALTVEKHVAEQAYLKLRTPAPAVKGDLLSWIEVSINYTPRSEEEIGPFASRMKSIQDAIELVDLKSKDVWSMMLLLNQAWWLEEKINAHFDRAHMDEYTKVKGMKGHWDEQRGFFVYVPYIGNTFIEVIFTRHRIFHDPKFKVPDRGD